MGKDGRSLGAMLPVSLAIEICYHAVSLQVGFYVGSIPIIELITHGNTAVVSSSYFQLFSITVSVGERCYRRYLLPHFL